MGLIICQDCGREISDRAPACIHCGGPVRPRGPRPHRSRHPTPSNGRERKVFHALGVLGEDRLLAFLRAIPPDRANMPVRDFLAAVDGGRAPDGLLFTGNRFGYVLSVSEAASGHYVIEFGYQAHFETGLGEKWEVRFSHDGRVLGLELTGGWIS